jgi:hypothetical protein
MFVTIKVHMKEHETVVDEAAAEDEGAEVRQPICRQAQQHTVQCPVCKRTMTIQSMKYTHRCKRAWDVNVRAN